MLSASDQSQCDLKEVMKENRSLRWAVALLVGAVLTSRSPASAISIVGEMRANGDFTKTVLRALLPAPVRSQCAPHGLQQQEGSRVVGRLHSWHAPSPPTRPHHPRPPTTHGGRASA